MVCAAASRVEKMANEDCNKVAAETGEKWLRNLVDHLGLCQEVYGAR